MVPTEKFAVDARLELLSALIFLARPRTVDLPYARKVSRHFAPFSGHPAVASLKTLLKNGVSEPLLAEIALLLPDAGGLLTHDLTDFFLQVREFSRVSRAPAFFASCQKDHARFLALARAEAKRGQDPREVAAYLRAPFPGRCRFVISPLLPPAFAVNVSRADDEVRVRGGSFGREGLTFEYSEFDCCPAHELTHTALAPLIDASRRELDAWSGLPPSGCRDRSWSGTIEEHLVRAITLRALKDDKRRKAILSRWSRSGYPYLPAVCSRLEEYEGNPALSFASFYPRLLACFC